MEKLPFIRSMRIGVILQTTWHMSLAKGAIEELAHRSESTRSVRVYRTENKQELKPKWFAGTEKASVIGGVNVHTQVLEDVASRIRQLAEHVTPAV